MVIVCLVPKPLLSFTVYKNYPEEALCLIDIKFRNEKRFKLPTANSALSSTEHI